MAYDAMTGVIEKGVIDGLPIRFGCVLTIAPFKKPPRQVRMGFRGKSQVIHLGTRLVYRVKIFRKWLADNPLNWPI